MTDRRGQTWETGGGELWLVTSSEPHEDGRTKHRTLILDSRVRSLVGHHGWHFELDDGWEHPANHMRRLA